MANTDNMNPQEIRIQGLLARYLAARQSEKRAALDTGSHLDQDLLSAFVEGNLSEREAKPVLSHLVDCSFCLHVSAELIRLDAAFAENESTVTHTATEPARISEVLSGLFSKIFGTSDGAVFAHQDEEDREDKEQLKDESE